MSITQMDAVTKNLILPLWHTRSLEGIDRFCLPDARIETTLISGTGPEILKKSAQETFAAFPDITFKVEDIFRKKNKIIYHWQASATHPTSLQIQLNFKLLSRDLLGRCLS